MNWSIIGGVLDLAATFLAIGGLVSLILGTAALRAATTQFRERVSWWAKYLPIVVFFPEFFTDSGNVHRRRSLQYFLYFIICFVLGTTSLLASKAVVN